MPETLNAPVQEADTPLPGTVVIEADTLEDRPLEVLAQRRREFLARLQSRSEAAPDSGE